MAVLVVDGVPVVVGNTEHDRVVSVEDGVREVHRRYALELLARQLHALVEPLSGSMSLPSRECPMLLPRRLVTGEKDPSR